MSENSWRVPENPSLDNSQDWHQTIEVLDGVQTPGRVDSLKRLDLLQLPDINREDCP